MFINLIFPTIYKSKMLLYVTPFLYVYVYVSMCVWFFHWKEHHSEQGSWTINKTIFVFSKAVKLPLFQMEATISSENAEIINDEHDNKYPRIYAAFAFFCSRSLMHKSTYQLCASCQRQMKQRLKMVTRSNIS